MYVKFKSRIIFFYNEKKVVSLPKVLVEKFD